MRRLGPGLFVVLALISLFASPVRAQQPAPTPVPPMPVGPIPTPGMSPSPVGPARPGTGIIVQPMCKTGCGGGGGDTQAPNIWFQAPGSGAQVTEQYPYMEIQFCDNASLNAGTRNITVNGNDVTSTFSYTTTSGGDCVGPAAYSNTSSIPLNIGSNSVHAYICDLSENCTTQDWTVSRVVPPTGPVIARDMCLTIAIGPSAAYECADLRIAHALPGVRTLGQARAPVLLYNSQHAHPFVVLNADVYAAAASGDTIIAQAYMKSGTNWNAKGRQAVRALQWGGSGSSVTRRMNTTFAFDTITGIYPFQLVISKWSASTSSYTTLRTDTGSVAIVNRRDSPFGAGWWLAGWERLLIPASGPLMWIGGDGSVRQYTNTGTWGGKTWYVARALDRPDTLYWDGSTYNRKVRGGSLVVFNDSGYHIRTINRLGYVTTFTRDASRRLSTIIVPPSLRDTLRYRFTYNGPNGTLDSVISPDSSTSSNRVTRFGATSITGGAKITTITDPGASTYVQFEYGSGTYTSAIVARTDRRGARTAFSLDSTAGLKVVASQLQVPDADSIIRRFCPAEVRNRVCGGIISPESSYTIYAGPRSSAGDSTHFWLDSLGLVTQTRDAYGTITAVTRGNSTYPALPTIVTGANSRTTTASYDTRGNLASVTDYDPYNPVTPAVYPTTSYTWDQTWDVPTFVTLPSGQYTQYNIESTTGNTLWIQDGRGSTSRLTFIYNTAGLGNGLVNKVVGQASDTTILTYDSTGNVASVRSPMHWTNYVLNDRLGRPIVSRTPLGPDTSSTAFRRDSTRYDAMGRVVRSVTYGDALGSASAIAHTLEQYYNDEGMLDSLRRSGTAVPSPGYYWTRWTYDLAGRVTASNPNSDSYSDSTSYDAASNVIRVRSRPHEPGWQAVTMTYDKLNRLVQRVVPGTSYDSVSRGLSTLHPFPWWPNNTTTQGYDIPADTSVFTYDAAGNMTRADNREAFVRRGYFRNGQVRWDSLVIRTWDNTDTTKHRYGISYAYDMNGRRTVVRYPAVLGSNTADTIRYVYSSTTGELTDVYDLQSNRFQFLYDLRGNLIRNSMPGNITDTLGYDADGRLTLDKLKSGNDTTAGSLYYPYSLIRNQTFSYHDPMRIYQASNSAGWQDVATTTYDGLGQLINLASTRQGVAAPWDYSGTLTVTERFWRDGLANQLADSTSTNLTRGAGYQAINTASPTTRAYGTSGRLRQIAVPMTRRDSILYNGAGDVDFLWTVPNSDPGNGTFRYENRQHYYDPSGQLRATEWRSALWTRGNGPGGLAEGMNTWQTAFDEYRYDALGRRILVKSTKDCNSTGSIWECRLGKIQRTVWDGNQVAWEIRMPTFSSSTWIENDTLPVNNLNLGVAPQTPYYFDPHPHYGRVGYTNGGGVDRPLSITRLAHVDFQADQYDHNLGRYTFPAYTIVPQWDYRGQADFGLLANGKYVICSGSEPYLRCATPFWRNRSFAYTQDADQVDRGTIGEAYTWIGSVTKGMENETHTQYMRNRYFDVITGQFTQEDPIGLAGGLSFYGFGNGDPVSFDDPFGLRVCAGSRSMRRGIEQTVDATIDWDAAGCASSAAQVSFNGGGQNGKPNPIQSIFLGLVESSETFHVRWGQPGSGSQTDIPRRNISIDPADVRRQYSSGVCLVGGTQWTAAGLQTLIAHELLGHGTDSWLTRHANNWIDSPLVTYSEWHAVNVENMYHAANNQPKRCGYATRF
jgi:RHS repeat-associated protein